MNSYLSSFFLTNYKFLPNNNHNVMVTRLPTTNPFPALEIDFPK
jgi:hypothetical protein